MTVRFQDYSRTDQAQTQQHAQQLVHVARQCNEICGQCKRCLLGTAQTLRCVGGVVIAEGSILSLRFTRLYHGLDCSSLYPTPERRVDGTLVIVIHNTLTVHSDL